MLVLLKDASAHATRDTGRAVTRFNWHHAGVNINACEIMIDGPISTEDISAAMLRGARVAVWVPLGCVALANNTGAEGVRARAIWGVWH